MDSGLPVGPLKFLEGRSCCHHWIIQPAVGPVSEGTCQKCGEVKEFKNSIDYETEWSNRKEMARSDMGLVARPLNDVDEMVG